MFTGIIEELGRVQQLEFQTAGARLTIECSAVLAGADPGASIAVNGACLTAVALTPNSFAADLAPETLKRTNLGDLHAGSPVNLERPLRAGARLEGHFVYGHVDAAAEIVSIDSLGGDNWWLRISVPQDLPRYIVSKGSLAVDGVSLTVAEIAGNLVAFTIVPYTWQHTTFRFYAPGARVNIEVDMLAKHLEKLRL
jgi:riboflavin synthase